MSDVQPTLTGPLRRAKSGGPARQLVVFLHGVGADGADLIDLAPYFAERLPDADFVAPNAPWPYDMAPFGYQWFSLQDRSPEVLERGVRAAAPILDAFLDRELAARGLTDAALALVGFSQGTMMSLHVAPRRAAPCAAVVGFSGRLVAPDRLPDELRTRPPVLLVHGEDDEVVPVHSLAAARLGLESAGLKVQSLTRPDLGHGIDEEGLVTAIRFVADHFAQK